MKTFYKVIMLKDKYTFTVDYAELSILAARIKAIQARAVIHPHTRPEGKSLELLLCGILKGVSRRLETKLYDYKANVKFQLSRQEMLAFHCAYKYQWIPYQTDAQLIFETIDKLI